MLDGTVGKRENGERMHPVDVELILCALFCGKSKDEVLKNESDITEQDFKDALTFSMYAVSKFNGKLDLKWDKDSPDNIWGKVKFPYQHHFGNA